MRILYGISDQNARLAAVDSHTFLVSLGAVDDDGELNGDGFDDLSIFNLVFLGAKHLPDFIYIPGEFDIDPGVSYFDGTTGFVLVDSESPAPSSPDDLVGVGFSQVASDMNGDGFDDLFVYSTGGDRRVWDSPGGKDRGHTPPAEGLGVLRRMPKAGKPLCGD